MQAEEEEHRHRCEVREWLRRGKDKDAEWLTGLIKGIAAKRGKPAAERLWRDIRQQWKLGNRGEFGDWRDGP
jgi:hypothetical protein